MTEHFQSFSDWIKKYARNMEVGTLVEVFKYNQRRPWFQGIVTLNKTTPQPNNPHVVIEGLIPPFEGKSIHIGGGTQLAIIPSVRPWSVEHQRYLRALAEGEETMIFTEENLDKWI